MKLTIDTNGFVHLWHNGTERIRTSYIGHMFQGDKLYPPTACRAEGNMVQLEYACGTVTLQLTPCDSYCKIEITALEGGDGFVYGPYATGLSCYGDIVGAAYDENDAVCIQSLNTKTCGGIPAAIEYPHKAKLLPPWDQYYKSWAAALPTTEGTYLQCYAQDRRNIVSFDFRGAKNAVVAEIPAEDKLVPGSAVALFACDFADLLPTIEKIELAENLPHPTIDGEWSKTSPRASETYLIALDSQPLEKHIDVLRRSGIKCIYFNQPFQSWGHFILNEHYFGDSSDDSMKKVSAQLAEQGFELGFHTLSNFIHTNDSYVTPVPDERLLNVDTTALVYGIDAVETELTVPEEQNYTALLPMNIVRLDKELIKYKRAECRDGKWVLTGCERGAYGTAASPHAAGETVNHLWSHGYQTLFPNYDMSLELVERLGHLISYCGIKRMSFDGLEGCTYLGNDQYNASEFVRRCYDIWGPEVRTTASISTHYNWHAHSYFDAGEPFANSDRRIGMFNYRGKNQENLRRNFFPGMLGQFHIYHANGHAESTSPDVLEDTMAMTVAHNAGCSLYISGAAFNNGYYERLMDIIRMWNDVRYHGDVPDSLREQMKAECSHWHIEETDGGWIIHHLSIPVQDMPYNGGLGHEGLVLDGAFHDQPLQLRIRVGYEEEKGTLKNPCFVYGWDGRGTKAVRFPITVHAGEYLVYEGGKTIERRNADFHLLETATCEEEPFRIGTHSGLECVQILYETEDWDIAMFQCKAFISKAKYFIKRKD